MANDARTSHSVSAEADCLLDWMVSKALPYWATAGFDREHRRFEERLTPSGERIDGVPIRLMSQARQIFVYSLAARRGWYPQAHSIIEDGFASMVRDFLRSEGWIHSIWRDGTPADTRRDLYAHAFVLLAIASYVDATGKSEALQLADRTLAFLDTNLAAPVAGGFLDSQPPVDDIRRQNPHMHMFEALLSLWECSKDERYLARAGEMFGLFSTRFYLPERGVLCEYFTESLEPRERDGGIPVEPGHLYEWVWLLRRFERASSRAVQPFVDAFYAYADTYGYDRDGLIVDEVLLDGRHLTPSRRTWPITEAVKANVVEAERGRQHAAQKAALLAERLHTCFLRPHAAGGWIDRLDREGNSLATFVPASTFYHVACAVDELARLASLRATGASEGAVARSSLRNGPV
jgi:mannose/cellobiose epimerase-like protein (N-acyl-D-glucosamine 2-epimerase family)